MLNAGVNRTATVYVSKKTIISKLIDNESKKSPRLAEEDKIRQLSWNSWSEIHGSNFIFCCRLLFLHFVSKVSHGLKCKSKVEKRR